MEKDFKPGLRNLTLTEYITLDHAIAYKEKQMAKKSEPIESVMIDNEEYFTVQALSKKYQVHAKRIHNVMTRMKIPRKQLGTMVVLRDDPRFDPDYKKPPNPGSFKAGEDDRRSKMLTSYIEISHNTTELLRDMAEVKEMLVDIIDKVAPDMLMKYAKRYRPDLNPDKE